MALYDAVRELELQVESFSTERRESQPSPEFKRVTTTVVLSGAGETGSGEDVTYQAEAHDGFPDLRERGRMTLERYSQALEPYELDDYRRWAFESAGLQLALRQNGRSFGSVCGREYRPVRFVVSTRLDIRAWLDCYPDLEFKLDPTSAWTPERMREIAATDRVRVVDLKGQYGGTWEPDLIDTALYGVLIETFPEAIVEDPVWTDDTRDALEPARERISWDAPIHSVNDISDRDPRSVNIKPSRFGTIERLLNAIDHCDANGITMYGGGQFELGVGRAQIQALASLFYPDSPNDVAPAEYNVGGARPGLPQSPLPPQGDAL